MVQCAVSVAPASSGSPAARRVSVKLRFTAGAPASAPTPADTACHCSHHAGGDCALSAVHSASLMGEFSTAYCDRQGATESVQLGEAGAAPSGGAGGVATSVAADSTVMVR